MSVYVEALLCGLFIGGVYGFCAGAVSARVLGWWRESRRQER